MKTLALLLSVFLLASSAVHAVEVVPELRAAESYRRGSDVDFFEAAWRGSAPHWVRAGRLEYTVGVIRDMQRSHAFAFIGPVWHLQWPTRAWFAEASFGPMLLTGSTIRDREFGGQLHFRSAIAIGKRFGSRRKLRIALRIFHISNGGLSSHNPGLDFVGVSFRSGD